MAIIETAQHLLLNRQIGWHDASRDGVEIDAETGQLHLQALPCLELDHPLTDVKGGFGRFVAPVSLAQDCQGCTYVLDAHTLTITRFDLCTQAFEVLPYLGGVGSEPRQFLDPHDIAISRRDDLYVADTGNRRILVFSLKGLVLRAIWGPLRVTRNGNAISVTPTMEQPSERDDDDDDEETESPRHERIWQPWSIAISGNNWAYVSDYTHGLIHVFDAWGKWQKAFTGATDQEPALEKPTQITLDKQGWLYILQEGKEYITVLDAEGNFQQRVARPKEIVGTFRPLALAVDEVGNLHVCDSATQKLYYYSRRADGTYASPTTSHSFSCNGVALIFDKTGTPLLLDAKVRKILLLQLTVLYKSEGTYYCCALDSELYRCQWHRILLSATIAPGTSVTVDTFTSETNKSIEEVQALSERWIEGHGQINSKVGRTEADWDCLVRSQPGRYLWLRLTLAGEGTTSPSVRQVRCYFPRASSLQYLPATYSEDAESRDFLDRFLSLFDTLRNNISQQITDIARYFDPAATLTGDTSSSDFLAWLAGWLGLTLDRHWPEEKRRKFVQQAHRLYRLRGTPEGLQEHIQLYTDSKVYILEHFKLRHWLFLDSSRLGEQSVLWGKGIMNRLQLNENARIGSFQLIDTGDPLIDPFYRDAHQFTVFVPTCGESSALQQETVQRIIEMAKPAHTQGYLQMEQPQFRIGAQSFLGITTVIGGYPAQVITGKDRLGDGSVLGPSPCDMPPTMQIGKRSRIGSSTLLT